MSKGLGRIERLIEQEIERTQGGGRCPRLCNWEPLCNESGRCPVQLCTFELLCAAYAPNDPPRPFTTFTPAQRKAVTRAMRSYVRKNQRYALAGGQGRKQLWLYEPDDPPSAIWVKMQIVNRRKAQRGIGRGSYVGRT